MTQKVKIRLPSGDLAVYLVDGDLAGYDNIREQGKQVARQFGGRWYRVGFGEQVRERLYDEDMREAEALPLAFDVPHPMWGLQVQVRTPGQLDREWRWVAGPGGPYRYHTEEEASQMLRLCYPEGVLGEDIRTQPL